MRKAQAAAAISRLTRQYERYIIYSDRDGYCNYLRGCRDQVLGSLTVTGERRWEGRAA